MHEMSIAAGILELVKEKVPPEHYLTAVQMTVGVLSGVCPHSLEFCFTELARQEDMGSPVLEIKTVPALTRCLDCGRESEVEEFSLGCPHCASYSREILSGYECSVDSFTIEEEPHDREQ